MRSAVCCVTVMALAMLSVNTVWAGSEEGGSKKKECNHEQGGKCGKCMGGVDRHEMMKSVDKDGDGKITKDEFISAHLEMLTKRFEAMDKDGDGALTEADREAAHKERQGKDGEEGAGKGKRHGDKERKNTESKDGEGKSEDDKGGKE